MPRALLSVSEKTGIVDVGRGLAARGFELVSTGGTARALSEAGLTVTSVSTVTGFPEMMDGRVKTLHPSLHGGILARRDHAPDLRAVEAQGIGLVDVVIVNLYPFVQAAANPSTPFDALVEQIDIGGPSLVRAAAKNFSGVLVAVDPADYPRLLAALDAGPTLAFRFELMRKAFQHTAKYDAAIAATLSAVDLIDGRFVRMSSTSLFEGGHLDLAKIRDLRYGENPHQRAAWLSVASSGRATPPAILQGKELSYTNLLDLDSAARLMLEFEEPAAVVIKHTNPCGVATGRTAADAYLRAREADPVAAYGGIVGLNRPIDAATAEALVSTFIEAVIAPSVDDGARDTLARKAKMRVVVADWPSLASGEGAGLDFRSTLNGLLVQQRDQVSEAVRPWTVDRLPDGFRIVTARSPSSSEWEALRFAWRVVAHVKSNAVIFTDHTRTLAIGAGQMSRVDAVSVAVMKAASGHHPLAGSVAASDAFFPFRDGLDAAAAAGATAIVQPGGSVRDQEVIQAADEHGLAMLFTGRRHFKH